eukprot:scaffold23592_cov88-Cyclotella_meneghiniana.AAC.4
MLAQTFYHRYLEVPGDKVIRYGMVDTLSNRINYDMVLLEGLRFASYYFLTQNQRWMPTSIAHKIQGKVSTRLAAENEKNGRAEHEHTMKMKGRMIDRMTKTAPASAATP